MTAPKAYTVIPTEFTMTRMLKSFLKPKASRVRNFLNQPIKRMLYDSMLLQGSIASWHVRAQKNISSLADVEFRVFSQCGEDGIIDWLIERAGLPTRLHTFVEFGVETYDEANTRFLLENRLWSGLVIDGDPKLNENLSRGLSHWRHNLRAKSAFITRDNINELILQAGFAGDVGLLSIDIDGNDYWVWEAINVIHPVICICEYNPIFGNMHSISVPYDAGFIWGQKHDRAYYGASILALSSLAARKGYRFLGTTVAANNAFFIREDYAAQIENALKNVVAYPVKTRSPSIVMGRALEIEAYDRHKTIQDFPVIETETGKNVILRELAPLYDETWLQQMGAISNP
jgi:hypothetical protein